MSAGVPLSLRLAAMLPGRRARWRAGFSLLLDHLRGLVEQGLETGETSGAPWLRVGGSGPRLHGFGNGDKELRQLHVLGRTLPPGLEPRYFRLAKDYVTRFMYPHLRPDLHPAGIGPDNWDGFHGQHKEPLSACAGIPEAVLRREFAPAEGQVVIDAGAYLGMGDLRMAGDVGPAGRIVAVEASPACHALLERNIEANAAANVTALHRAMWDSEGETTLECGQAQANTLIPGLAAGDGCVTVRTTSVDGIVESLGLERVDMLSLTVNGAELEGLAGAARTLREMRPRVRLAGWYERDGQPLWRAARRMLREQGYAVAVSPRGDVLAVPGERAGGA